MSIEVSPFRVESVSVDQDEESIEAASVSGVSFITVMLDRRLHDVEKAEIRRYFEMRNNPTQVLGEPSFSGPKVKFSATDPTAAISAVECLRDQASSIAELTGSRLEGATSMLTELERDLQPPRGEGDFRPVQVLT